MALVTLAALAIMPSPAQADTIGFFGDSSDWILELFGLRSGNTHHRALAAPADTTGDPGGGSGTPAGGDGTGGGLEPHPDPGTLPPDPDQGGGGLIGGGGSIEDGGDGGQAPGDTQDPTPVPEPATLLLVGLGTMALTAIRRSRRS